MFPFKHGVIKLTSAVFFLARMHIKENTCELISTIITNRRKEYLLCKGNKYSVICSMAIFILKLNVNTLKIFSVRWEEYSRAAAILIFEGSECVVVKSYVGNVTSLLWYLSQQARKSMLVCF